MPRSVNYQTYDPSFELLLLKAHDTTGFTLPTATPQLARSLRARIYGYFNALRRAAPPRPELVEMANSFTLKLDGPNVLFIHTSNTWESRTIQAALGLGAPAKPRPILSPQEQRANKLALIREREAQTTAVLKKFIDS